VSNYTKSTNFATKDALASGNALKIVKGTEIDTEFNNIATAIATKTDSVSPTFTGTMTYGGVTLSAAVTGTGKMVLDTSPTLATPILGVATATSINKLTVTAPTTSATLTVADGASLVTSGAYSLTLTSTATTNVTFPTTGTLATLTGSETFTNKTLGAGTASVPSIKLTSGTNLTSATAGAIEYDGKVIYATPIGTQRGIVPTQQYYRLESAYVGSNTTGAQSLLGVGVTLSANTVYEFEIEVGFVKTAGATSHTISLGFGGTATVNNIFHSVVSLFNSGTNPMLINASQTLGYITTTAATVVTGAGANASIVFALFVKGTVSINAGGTFIPQYTLSAAPGGAYSAVAGSYIRINPLSASGAATNVGTWS
jgi:hypothetical protein